MFDFSARLRPKKRARWRLSRTWLVVLPPAFSFITAGVVIAATDRPSYSVPLFLGIIAGGMVEMDHRVKGRVINAGYMLIGFACASLLMQLSIDRPIISTLLLTGLSFGLTMFAAVDTRFRTLAFGTLVVSLYTLLTAHLGLSWYLNPLMICCGALLHQLMTLLLHIVSPSRPVQHRLAQAYRSLASYGQLKAQLFEADEIDSVGQVQLTLADKNHELTEAFNQCRDALFYRAAGQSATVRTQRQLRDYFVAQDIHERLTSAHVDYAAFAADLADSEVLFRLERLVRLQGQVFAGVAQALDDERLPSYPEKLRRAMDGVKTACKRHEVKARWQTALPRLLANLEEVNRQLARLSKPMAQSTRHVLDQRIASQDALTWQVAWRRVRDQLNRGSGVFRHAVRVAVLAFVSSVIVHLFDLHLGYWIFLTALFVLQPNYSATQKRMAQRIIGTLFGVFIGALVPLISPSVNTMLMIMVVANVLFFYFRARNYSFSTLFITLQVLVGFSLIGIDVSGTIVARIFDTLLGAAMAWLCVVYWWPDWKFQHLSDIAQRALNSLGRYVHVVIGQFQRGSDDDVCYRSARRRVHEHAATLAQLSNEMHDNSERYGDRAVHARNLLECHYRLLGYLSALGAYRGQIEPIEAAAFAPYQEACEALADVLDQFAAEPTKLSAAQERLDAALGALPEEGDGVLIGQLNLAAALLPEYGKLLRQC
ncbi:YccS family putative transporter [Suttonella sp. R2A3]|uniref:YccS family putative transporter n=1 Tax=Suttonella sp. R2A3 TaxID=2908648 RepID=UPI001F1E7314|nr:YccS family putative transporter [Suttonella sp. R2A3]UJF25066.1 YccS family putative transporter [Suttonella sp. R2A3]